GAALGWEGDGGEMWGGEGWRLGSAGAVKSKGGGGTLLWLEKVGLLGLCGGIGRKS
ncbi:hypothetical protein PanWU01x14_283360, partial [Parasponia andersonii]